MQKLIGIRKFKFLVLLSLVFISVTFTSCVNGKDDNSALPSTVLKYPAAALRLVVDDAEIQAAATTTAHAQGGTPAYTYSLLSGAGIVNSVTGLFTPDINFAGTAVIQVSDNSGQSAAVSVLVDPPLKVTPQSSVKYVNQVLPLVASGGKAPYLFTLIIGAATLSPVSPTTMNVTMPAVQTTILILVTDALGDKVTADITVISPLLALADADIIPSNREMKIKISGGKIFNPALTAPSGEYQITLQQGVGLMTRIDANTWKYTPPSNPYQEERGLSKVKVLVSDNNSQSVLVQFEIFIPPDVALGLIHSCALNNKTGAAKCWGDNLRGQLGEADPLKKNQSYWGDEPNEQSTVTENFLRVDFLTANETASQCGQLIDYAVGQDLLCAIVSVGCGGSALRDVRCYGSNDSANNNGLDYLSTIENDFYRYRHPILQSEGNNSQLYRWSLADWYNANYNPAPYFQRTTNVIPSQSNGMSELRINSGYQLPMNDYSYLDKTAGFKPDKIYLSQEGYYDPNLSLLSTTGTLRTTGNGTGNIWGGGGVVPQIPVGPGINYKSFAFLKFNVYAYRTCYIGTDDYGYCFGSNFQGLTGRGDTGPLNSSYTTSPSDQLATRATTGINATVDKVSSISLGSYSGCAIFDATATKSVGCWGTNVSGTLGIANPDYNFFRGSASSYVQKNMGGTLMNAVKIKHTGGTGQSYSPTAARVCASISDGSLWCWGGNDANQFPGYFGDQTSAVQINLGANEQVVDFDLMGGSTCVITRNSFSLVKSLKCWGGSTGGNNERDSYSYPKPRPGAYAMTTVTTFVTGAIDPTQIKMSIHGGCMIDGTSKYLKCWGDNRKSMLGIGNGMRGNKPLDMGSNLPVIDVGSGRTIKKLVAGGENTCAILDNNLLKCWGTNEFGQLGLGRALGVDGHAHLGDNDGEMGDSLPNLTFPGESANTVSNVAVGRDHLCAVTLTNKLFCWGDNTKGQLGINSPTQIFSSPQNVDITGLGTVTGLALGFTHTCATFDLAGTRSLRCWGSHANGQLGYGDLDYTSGIGAAGHTDKIIGNQVTDVAVKNLPAVDLGGMPIQSVSAGGFNTCVLFVNGRVRCFGNDLYGQIGIGSYDLNNSGFNSNMGDKLAEVGYKFLIDFGINPLTQAPHYALQVSVGTDFVCAVLDSNKLKCWGHNSMGQLGIENTQSKGVNNNEMGSGLSYVNLEPGLGVLSVSTGLANSCAVLTNAAVKCWGVNFSGQLGFGMDYSRGYTTYTMGTSLPYVDLVWP